MASEQQIAREFCAWAASDGVNLRFEAIAQKVIETNHNAPGLPADV